MARILIADDRDSMRSALKGPAGKPSATGSFAAKRRMPRKPSISHRTAPRPDRHGFQECTIRTVFRLPAKILQVTPSVPIIMFTLYKTDELEAAAKAIGVRCVIGRKTVCQR